MRSDRAWAPGLDVGDEVGEVGPDDLGKALGLLVAAHAVRRRDPTVDDREQRGGELLPSRLAEVTVVQVVQLPMQRGGARVLAPRTYEGAGRHAPVRRLDRGGHVGDQPEHRRRRDDGDRDETERRRVTGQEHERDHAHPDLGHAEHALQRRAGGSSDGARSRGRSGRRRHRCLQLATELGERVMGEVPVVLVELVHGEARLVVQTRRARRSLRDRPCTSSAHASRSPRRSRPDREEGRRPAPPSPTGPNIRRSRCAATLWRGRRRVRRWPP